MFNFFLTFFYCAKKVKMLQISGVFLIMILFHCNCDETHVNWKKSYTQPKVPKQEMHSHYWNNAAQEKLIEKLSVIPNTNKAKNVILFIGDGMSMATITSARIYAGQKLGKAGEDHVLSFEKFPFTALSKPYCVDKQTADSACSATAYFSGVKGRYGTIGVNAQVPLHNCSAMLNKSNHVTTIMQWAQDANKYTGVVTTTRVTHASPAGAYAHIANREWESDHDMKHHLKDSNCKGRDIALQLVRNSPGRDLNLIMGGGRVKLLPKNTTDGFGNLGKRHDDLNLIDEWIERHEKNGLYIQHRKQLEHINKRSIKHVLGLFAPNHLNFHLFKNASEPTLREMTVAAINFMKKSKNGYVLFVEGGLIDKAHHFNEARLAIDETVEFDKAVQAAVDMTDESETLIVVTADHSHTMTLSGYNQRGKGLFKLNDGIEGLNDKPYVTISYANGPTGSKAKSYNISEEEMSEFFIIFLKYKLSFCKFKKIWK
jgi:alkaline phosphatase